MNSGLYARLGSSATASAAAWANRLLSPITNCSNVIRGSSAWRAGGRLAAGATPAGPTARRRAHRGGLDRRGLIVAVDLDPRARAEDCLGAGLQERGEAPLHPAADVVRCGEHQRVVA